MKYTVSVAKRLMEEEAVREIMTEFDVDMLEAMNRFYSTKTYFWFSDENDDYGVAREGGTALAMRVVAELRDGTLI
ncbi:MAG: hypothetical protein FWG70_12160 [Oscillospiraceae bacterium]|nr:hypothetical protein [Oscillospiraceae bacterium]